MLVVYEKEEGFFDKLKKIPETEKPNTRLFVSRVRDINENGTISPSIIVQMAMGDDVYMLRYTGDMGKFQFISSFENIQNDAMKEQAQKDYNQSYIAFEQNIEAEYNKMMNLIKSMGYSNIENAVIS